jgi:transposase
LFHNNLVILIRDRVNRFFANFWVKGYDSDRLRRQIERQGAAPNIPPKPNRKYKPGFSPALYRERNAIERSSRRIKGFRRAASRYDKLSRDFLAALRITATVCYWL